MLNYIHNGVEKTEIKAAGFPAANRGLINWGNFNKGQVFPDGKLQKRRVKGGVILSPISITL